MKALITGSTGMIGGLIVDHCLQSDTITEVITIVRRPQSVEHPKLKPIVIKDFKTYDNQTELFQNIDVAYFCLGAYTGQVPKDLFKDITVDYAVNFAKRLQAESPDARLCLLSGQGADRKEKSRTAFAKFKGIAENQIVATGIEFYTFRPSYIYPVTPRKEPNFMYKATRAMYPLIRLFGKNASIKSTELAEAMFRVGMDGGNQEILENKDILEVLN